MESLVVLEQVTVGKGLGAAREFALVLSVCVGYVPSPFVIFETVKVSQLNSTFITCLHLFL